MNLPRVPARWHLAAIASILGALGALAALLVAAAWLYDRRNAPVLVPVAFAYLALDVAMHWANIRRWAAVRDLAERAADDADRALGVQLANAETDVIPTVVVHDLPRRPRPWPADDVDEVLKRFNFSNGGRA